MLFVPLLEHTAHPASLHHTLRHTFCQVSEHVVAGGCPDVEDAPRVTDYPEKV